MKPMVVIVLCHNNLRYTQGLVSSVLKAKDSFKDVVMVFVDNASTDGTAEWLSEECESWGWVYRRNEANKWFTEANEEVIRAYPGHDVYMLNNDVVVFDGWLSGREELGEWAAIGATQVHPQEGRIVTFAGGGADFAGHKVMWEWRDKGAEIHEEEWLTGAALMVERSAYDKVGGLDLQLKHYCQDSDLSLALRKAGYKVGVSRRMRIVHYGGVTTAAVGGRVGEQGDVDQRAFAKKWRVKCGRHDYSVAVDNTEFFKDPITKMRNMAASKVEADGLLKAFDLKGKKVLELGCAYGNVVKSLRAEGVDAYGIDRMEVIGKEDYLIKGNLTDGYMWENAGYCDMIFSKAVLEHIPESEIASLIERIKTSLKPGGLTHHNIDTAYGTDSTHICIHPIEWWNAMFCRAGFKNIEMKLVDKNVWWCTWEKIELAKGGADYFDKEYFEDATKNGLKDSFNRYFKDGVEVANRLELLIPEMKKEWVVLEFGCAYGHTLKALHDKNYTHLHGFDISEYAVSKGRKEFRLDLMQADIEKEDFIVMGGADLVYSCITLEHIHSENADLVVANLAKATKIGGYNYHAIDLVQGQDTTHYCIKPRQWWIDLFEKHGFTTLPLTAEQVKLNWFLFRRSL